MTSFLGEAREVAAEAVVWRADPVPEARDSVQALIIDGVDRRRLVVERLDGRLAIEEALACWGWWRREDERSPNSTRRRPGLVRVPANTVIGPAVAHLNTLRAELMEAYALLPRGTRHQVSAKAGDVVDEDLRSGRSLNLLGTEATNFHPLEVNRQLRVIDAGDVAHLGFSWARAPRNPRAMAIDQVRELLAATDDGDRGRMERAVDELEAQGAAWLARVKPANPYPMINIVRAGNPRPERHACPVPVLVKADALPPLTALPDLVPDDGARKRRSDLQVEDEPVPGLEKLNLHAFRDRGYIPRPHRRAQGDIEGV